jgi:hypothetical protein
VFTPGYFILDQASGKVLAFVDWNDPKHLLLQTDSTKQVRPPVRDVNGRWAADFTMLPYYQSNRSTTYWAYTANGVGFRAIGLFTPSSVTGSLALLSTLQAANVQGLQVFTSGTSASMNAFKVATATIATHAFGTVALNTPFVFDVFHSSAGSPQRSGQINNAAATSGTLTAAMVAGATSKTFTLCALGDGLTPYSGKFSFLALRTSVDAVWAAACKRYLVEIHKATA